MSRQGLYCVCLSVLTLASLNIARVSGADALPSWNDGPAKKAIVAFVERVTDKSGPEYVDPADRIATFDNDGTLWCEKPIYIHLFANVDRFKELMKANPTLADEELFKAIESKDLSYFTELMEKGEIDTIVSDLFGVPFDGMTTDEFAKWNRDWLARWKHPRFETGYTSLTYRPMVELVHYLRDNEFDVHIFTADEGAFLKLASNQLYGIPPKNVHGSSIKLKYELERDDARLVRTAETQYFDNWDAKPRLIYRSIGKRPIFAAGNSNGDLHMLQYTTQQNGPSMSVLVHHTDSEREYAYDSHTDKVMPLASQESWTVIDMKNDWKTVFSDAE